MTTSCSKKDTTVKDMLCKPPLKKAEQRPPTLPRTSPPMLDVEASVLTTEQSVTYTFLETIFGTLSEDIVVLKRHMAADVKDIKWELTEMGQRIDTLETANDQREEELNTHQEEVLELHNKNKDLYYRLEDL
ncbi:hypothetical protein NDU88_006297 [Pleurodeles waltl]|uniref:Uncharacterized protein n=1 Tax=Pleurodeles waltl TaxID=8319 RepID=A0AAV7TXW5_PLEWA|nr:hypothetical protein NDU88_006297 [Pleurodeles waltl]